MGYLKQDSLDSLSIRFALCFFVAHFTSWHLIYVWFCLSLVFLLWNISFMRTWALWVLNIYVLNEFIYLWTKMSGQGRSGHPLKNNKNTYSRWEELNTLPCCRVVRSQSCCLGFALDYIRGWPGLKVLQLNFQHQSPILEVKCYIKSWPPCHGSVSALRKGDIF